jgi:hypothetical protein
MVDHGHRDVESTLTFEAIRGFILIVTSFTYLPRYADTYIFDSSYRCY